MRILRWIGFAFAAILVTAFATGFAARFADGPLGPFPGGAIRSGEWVRDTPVDWDSFADIREVQFGLLEPPRSRTTWFLVRDGKPYVPCAFPNFTLLKKWPHEVQADPRVVLRIDGRRYRRRAIRVMDPEEYAELVTLAKQKYGEFDSSDPDDLWYFRLDPDPPR